MSGEHRTNLGNDGNGNSFNEHDRRRGADPPNNVSGSTGIESSVENSKKCVKTGNCSCNTVTDVSGPISMMWIMDVRSRHSSAAIRVSTRFLSTV